MAKDRTFTWVIMIVILIVASFLVLSNIKQEEFSKMPTLHIPEGEIPLSIIPHEPEPTVENITEDIAVAEIEEPHGQTYRTYLIIGISANILALMGIAWYLKRTYK